MRASFRSLSPTLADTLMNVNAKAAEGSRPAVLRSGRPATAAARRGAARGALQGARRPGTHRDRELPCRRRGGLRLRVPGRARTADGLATPADPARGGTDRGGAQARDLGLLPARSRVGRAARVRAWW